MFIVYRLLLLDWCVLFGVSCVCGVFGGCCLLFCCALCADGCVLCVVCGLVSLYYSSFVAWCVLCVCCLCDAGCSLLLVNG